jgi:hypothetical protein
VEKRLAPGAAAALTVVLSLALWGLIVLALHFIVG